MALARVEIQSASAIRAGFKDRTCLRSNQTGYYFLTEGSSRARSRSPFQRGTSVRGTGSGSVPQEAEAPVL